MTEARPTITISSALGLIAPPTSGPDPIATSGTKPAAAAQENRNARQIRPDSHRTASSSTLCSRYLGSLAERALSGKQRHGLPLLPTGGCSSLRFPWDLIKPFGGNFGFH